MYFAYVVKSEKKEFYYKGHCENLRVRLQQHNSGLTKSLKSYLPFTLVYFESFETRKEAKTRETYFKSASGRRYLKQKISAS
jgi:putative endonuclease